MSRNRSASFTTVIVLILTAFLLLSARSAFAAGPWGANYFPNVELITQDGKKVRFYDDLLKGKIVAIDLIYTHCKDMCPLETARLAQVQRMLGDRVGKDIFFYSVSIDPKEDTPEVMKAYAEKFHAGPGWLFLTGKKEDIDLISKKLGLYTDTENRDGHAPALLLGNEPAGQWMQNSATDNPRFLANLIGNSLDSWRHATKAENSTAEAIPLNLEKGHYVFATHCAACHTIGKGDYVGPDLRGVTKVRDRAWLLHFIQRPDEMLAAKDPIATALLAKYKVQMPNLRLATEDVNAVIGYLERLPAAPAATASVSANRSAGPSTASR